jgi:hypothetical protein
VSCYAARDVEWGVEMIYLSNTIGVFLIEKLDSYNSIMFTAFVHYKKAEPQIGAQLL